MWNRKYYNIGLKFEPKIVRIKNDEYLRDFLATQPGAAMRLATVIRKAYRMKFGVDLQITTDSLATEIVGHFKIKKVCSLLDGLDSLSDRSKSVRDFLDSMQLHMDVIDCGEKDVDNNRWVWDYLQWSALAR